jgi:hypothetical protein
LIHVAIEPTFTSFRQRARPLLATHVAPADVVWDDGRGQRSLFGSRASAEPSSAPAAGVTVPAAFVAKGELAALPRIERTLGRPLSHRVSPRTP